MCPSQSALDERGSAEGKLLQTPLLDSLRWEEGTLASGLGRQGSALLQTHSGRRGQKQWLEAFGRGPEEKKILSLQQLHGLLHCGCSHMPVAPKQGAWTERPHTSRTPSQTKPVVSSLHYPHHPSPSLPDTEQRDQEPAQEHQRAMSFVPPGRAPQQACTRDWWDAGQGRG